MNDDNDRNDATEARLARLDGEHVSLVKLLFETRDENARRLDAIETAVRQMNTLIEGVMQGLQRPGRGLNDGLLEIIARIMTRLRAVEENQEKLTDLVANSHQLLRDMQAVIEEFRSDLRGGPEKA